MTIFLAILTSTGIFVCFKYLEKFKIEILPAIVVNYVTASVCGFVLATETYRFTKIVNGEWLGLSIFIGVIFIAVFFIIGKSTQKAGIAVTTLAGKMSFVLPILFSILCYHEEVSFKKFMGFAMAVIAVFLSIYKDRKTELDKKYLWLPIVLFFGAGFVDSLLKYAQDKYLSSGGAEQFSAFLFAIAAVSGLLVLALKKESLIRIFSLKVIIGGIFLGLANFGSLYFLIASLNHSGLDSSIVFSIVNIGIVSLSLVFGLGVFGERLNRVNIVGIIMAFIAIFVLAY